LIARHGVRNSRLTAIAPADTISLLAGNVSSGPEPMFAFEFARDVPQPDGGRARFAVGAHAVACYRALHPGAPLPGAFVAARDVAADDQLAMQAALQPHVDNAISKTINVAADVTRVAPAA
jgi:ribonucleoside-diphosphate reductase alpha chain